MPYYNRLFSYNTAAVRCMVFSISPDHPALAGHFPGHPIVPGVVLMEHVLRAVAARWPQHVVCGVHKWRFQQVLLPGQTGRVVLSEPTEERVRFRCESVAGQVLCSGTLLLASSVAP